jgi:4-hydroxy-3-polyprenylbenzoate decarboxylase
MPYKNLQHFISVLEEAGELVRIREYVNPKLEISEITDRISKNDGPALLFENTGYEFPLLINSMGSYKRMCMALGVHHLDEITNEIELLFKTLMKPRDNVLEKLKMLPKLSQIASWMPKVKSGKGECQQVIMQYPDITKLPVLTCWPHDGGPFITLPVIHTQDPVTGIRNVGMYRMQVFSPQLTALHWHKHKVSARHFNEYKKLKRKMPVAVSLGGDPVYTYAATAPLPDNIDEYMLAGFLRKKKVELVKCLSLTKEIYGHDVYVPADSDFVIEGYVDPDEDLILEGPFGDHTGYYSLADFYPRFHITAITHKRDAIYPATIVGIPPQEDAWIGKATERIFLAPIKMTVVPEIKDMELPIEGVFHNLTIVKINKTYSGQALKVMNALWGAGQMMLNKILVVVDDNVNIHDYSEVAKTVSENTDPQNDIYFGQGPMDVLDHSCSKFAFGGKMCIDATRKFEEEEAHPLTSRRSGTSYSPREGECSFNLDKLKKIFPEITGINNELLKHNISVVFVGIIKNRKNHIPELNEKLFTLPGFSNVKFIIYIESNIDLSEANIADLVWKASNNLDPRRDSYIIKSKDRQSISHIGFDGTRKTKEYDGFLREWPNILVSDKETIKTVDLKWKKLNLGKFLPSPSLKYQKQLYKGGAVAE